MTWPAIAAAVTAASRVIVLTLVSASGVVALTHWAVRRRHLSAFGALPRTVRRLSDPVLRPLESRLVRWGRNPQDAALWLVGLAVGLGILLLSVIGWATGWIGGLLLLQQAGPAAWAHFLLNSITQVLLLAILVRVIGSWVGATAFTPWMRPFVWMTEWLIGPIRRRLPAFGMFDLSPVVAYFAVMILSSALSLLIP